MMIVYPGKDMDRKLIRIQVHTGRMGSFYLLKTPPRPRFRYWWTVLVFSFGCRDEQSKTEAESTLVAHRHDGSFPFKNQGKMTGVSQQMPVGW